MGFHQVLAFGMIAPITHADVPYRGYSLHVTYAVPQWRIAIVRERKDLPEPAPERQILRGWNQEEVLKRAMRRIDTLMEGRHSN
jgi:hypothetical protein